MTQSLDAWLDRIGRQHPNAIELGLERVRTVAGRLGIRRPARHVLTVAGTNGKGSTVAFAEAIARAAGLRVGAYTSPHLLRYNERVRIDGAEASDAALVEAFEAVEGARGTTSLTYFEYGTLAALWLFERAALDLAVLEVGLGGRLDAVNIVDPDVAVITTVDLDHADWLGSDRESIGAEKAGIMRGWRPVVLGERDPPSSVLRRAYAVGASAIRLGCDFFVDAPPLAGEWTWREPGFEMALPAPALPAPAQRDNAATAIAALRALDLDLPQAAFARGVATAALPGRLQRIVRDGVDIVLDIGHNPQAARELGRWLDAQRPVTTHAVFAALGDKDLPGLVAPLVPRIGAWFLAGLEPETPRGLAVDRLAARLGEALPRAERHATVATALDAACGAALPGERVLVFGSFFTVAAALRRLQPAAVG
ncbi:bifunctional tetrahydrofolate synthase/dihydrofolate synthase [Coralloluteibacterium stylophorae]|uniref:Dihydrofolate synthase/folylpolyglutamate synthase n=1 Tax=Coralloluteibacterium stylophorae TaxID=1776034 RepID=A0A8J8AXM7_9GAMM|nr:bifunctional tetrahydrofolate synthase/dihydrofolate synthase [Coralloluteibacterium stylophorae]